MGAMMRSRSRGTRKTAAAAPEGTEVAPVEEAAPAPQPRRRFIINLNMLSNVDVKFYTEGENRQDVVARWQAAIGRAKREQPQNTVEVVMGEGDAATSFILYLAEVTAFAVGPFVDESDAIDCTVNV